MTDQRQRGRRRLVTLETRQSEQDEEADRSRGCTVRSGAHRPERAGRGGIEAAWTKNCTALHKKYPHGVGRVNAKDKTSGTPVKTFKKSNKLFATAMKYNKGLDRDKDKIACEQK